jgi:hypothetical protein
MVFTNKVLLLANLKQYQMLGLYLLLALMCSTMHYYP